MQGPSVLTLSDSGTHRRGYFVGDLRVRTFLVAAISELSTPTFSSLGAAAGFILLRIASAAILLPCVCSAFTPDRRRH
jgi:hypothetical protein